MIQPRVRVRGIMTTYNCPSAALLSSSDRDVSSDSQAKWKAEMGSPQIPVELPPLYIRQIAKNKHRARAKALQHSKHSIVTRTMKT